MKKICFLTMVLIFAFFCFTGCTLTSRVAGTKWLVSYAEGLPELSNAVAAPEITFTFHKSGSLTVDKTQGTSTDSAAGNWSANENELSMSLFVGSKTIQYTGKVEIKKNTMYITEMNDPKSSKKTNGKLTLEKLGLV